MRAASLDDMPSPDQPTAFVTAATTTTARGPTGSPWTRLLGLLRFGGGGLGPEGLDVQLTQEEVDQDLRHGRDDE